MIYFTADLHFGHEKIIRHRNRPFKSAEEMDSKLVKNWNNTVNPTDEVYILGDLTMRGGGVANEFLKALNGTKYFICGNHDNFIDDPVFDQGLVAWVKDYFELIYSNYQFILFHYPIVEWHNMRRGAVHLHGHIHSDITYNLSMMEQGVKRLDVGVDANDYTPVSIEEIIKNVG